MRWKTRIRSEWMTWFAWFPVHLGEYKLDGGNQYVWLRFIERKGVEGYAQVHYEYRL